HRDDIAFEIGIDRGNFSGVESVADPYLLRLCSNVELLEDRGCFEAEDVVALGRDVAGADEALAGKLRRRTGLVVSRQRLLLVDAMLKVDAEVKAGRTERR